MIKQEKLLSLKDYEFSLEVDAKSGRKLSKITSTRCHSLRQNPIG